MPPSRLRVIAILTAAVPAILVCDYTLNHFYEKGAYFWDSGLLAFLVTYSSSWPMAGPTIYNPNYFSIHFQPLFYLTSGLHRLVWFVPSAAYFSWIQGVWAGVLAGAVFVLLRPRQSSDPVDKPSASSAGLAWQCISPRRAWTRGTRPGSSPRMTDSGRIGGIAKRSAIGVANDLPQLGFVAAAAVLTALCGPMLAAVGFPHPEIAIPALLLLFLALQTAGHRLASLCALACCLAVREDAGLHVGGLLMTLAFALWLAGASRRLMVNYALIAACCILYSMAALLVVRHFSHQTSSLTRVYLGSPALAHVSWALISRRLAFFWTARAYVGWPLVSLLLVAVWRLDPVAAVGPLSVLPWIIFSLVAFSDAAGSLTSYYSFPTITAIAWPSVAWFLGSTKPSCRWIQGIGLQCFVSALSILLFVTYGASNHDNEPWTGLQTPPLGAIGKHEAGLEMVLDNRRELGRLLVDDAVASLIPEALGPCDWLYSWIGAAEPRLRPDAVLFKRGAWDAKDTTYAISLSDLQWTYQIGDLPFFIASRTELSVEGNSLILISRGKYPAASTDVRTWLEPSCYARH